MSPDAATFRDWLQARSLAPRTATVYAMMVDYGQRHGNVAAAMQTVHTRASQKVVKAALGWWCRWTPDRRAARRVRILMRQQVRLARMRPVSGAERAALLARIRMLEEPYRSAMVVITSAGLRLQTAFAFTREQALVAGQLPQVPGVVDAGVVSPPFSEEVRQALRSLTRYGGWTHLRELIGRDYAHAYRQVLYILNEECRKAGIRRIRPAEFGRAGVSLRDLVT